jgi:hypothetical protein
MQAIDESTALDSDDTQKQPASDFPPIAGKESSHKHRPISATRSVAGR